MSLLSAISNRFHRRRKSHDDDDGRNKSRSKSPESSRRPSRSPGARPPKADEDVREKSGLFALNQIDAVSGSNAVVDIVAVHGLGGDWEQTWTDENGNLWLRDFLPLHLPHQARIFSYGYDSSTAFSRSVADIEVEAAMLLDRLQGERKTQEEQSRPVFFIAHSLGGILVKKAMVLANERPDHYEKLLHSIKASVFMAVPHRGADIAFWATFAARLLRNAQLGFGGNPAYVKALQRNSKQCADISRQFVGRSSKLSIRTFFETEQMGNQLIVDRDSACLNLPNELAIGIAGADHRSICKFANIDSQKYKPVRLALDKLVADAVPIPPPPGPEPPKPEPFSMSKEELECYQALYRSNYESHKSVIPKRVPGTLEWFLQHSNYVGWRNSPGDAALWITADPGCGKTVLASSVINELHIEPSSDASEQALTCYFFFKDDNETQASADFALCSILHQLVSSDNRLITAVMKEYRAKEDKLFSDVDALWNVFINTISLSTLPSIICVLDALDECSIGTRDQLIRKIVEVFSDYAKLTGPKSHAKLKLLTTSRPLASIEKAFTKISKIRLKAENESEAVEEDIGRVIHARINDLAGSKNFSAELQNKLQTHLTGNADRTFLWVSLILQQIENSMSASEASVEAIISSVPRTLDALYEKILSEAEDQDRLRKLLHIIVGAKAYLSLAELNIALHIDSSNADYTSLRRQCEPSAGMENFIKSLCGPFVRISSSHVYLVHQTAKEFLVQQQKPTGITPSGWKHSLPPVESNLILAQSCIWYLLLSEFSIPWVRLSESGKWKASPKLSRYLKDHDFLAFASRHWTSHFASASPPSHHPLTALARELIRTTTPRFRTWYKIYWSALSRGTPRSCTDLGEAAAFNLCSVIELMLTAEEGVDVNAADDDGDTALHTACMHKRYDTAAYLIQQGAAIDVVAHDGNVALSTAAAFGLTRIVEILVARGADVNPRNARGKTPLDRALEFGHAECVKRLRELGGQTGGGWERGEGGEDEDEVAGVVE